MNDKFIAMRTALNNPFQPGSDVIPMVWAGRVDYLSDWRDVLRPRLVAGLFERGRTILGEPGMGKSTLVRRIAADAAARGDWATPQIRLALGTDPLKRVATELLSLANMAGLASQREAHISALLERVQTLAVSGVSVSMRSPAQNEPHVALTELLVEIGRAAIARGNAVLIHLDEVQNVTDRAALSQLLIGLGDAITQVESVTLPCGTSLDRSLPIAIYLTGLPEFDSSSGTRMAATFTRRFRTSTLQPLADDDVRAALQEFVIPGWEVVDSTGQTAHVRMEPAAVDAIVDICKGEPFLFQLAGERAWYVSQTDLITRQDVLDGWRSAESEATAHVERILEGLPDRERTFLEAMAHLPENERRLSRIAAEAGFARAADAGPASQRLDRVRGIIQRGSRYSFRHRALEAYLTTTWPAVSA